MTNDPRIRARIVSRRPLYYSAGADELLDRPGYVRAGSGLTSIGGRLALVQDDANFLAVVDPYGMAVDAISLPACPIGLRQFDDTRGNKHWKLDLEACTTIADEEREVLIAMGSGSTPRREHIVLIDWPPANPSVIKLLPAPGFYEMLRSLPEFSGSELNLEGALYLGHGTLRLFQRSNGAPRNGVLPVNATCDISWPQLRAHLTDPLASAPTLRNVVQYDLGFLDGVPLSFTDAALRSRKVFFTAAAEASAGVIEDGPVMGSVLGCIDEDGTTRWAAIQDYEGRRLLDKVEGLSLDGADDNRGWIVIDNDNSSTPSDLCEVELQGDWH